MAYVRFIAKRLLQSFDIVGQVLSWSGGVSMKIDIGNMMQQINITSKAKLLSRLEVGDTMRVQVTGVSDHNIMLRLPDGTILEAASLSKLNVNLGDFIELKVNQKSDNQFFVEIVHQNTAQDSGESLKRMIVQLEVPFNEKNEAIVSQMLKNEIPITQEHFQEISTLMKQHQQPASDNIVFLMAHDIPVNEQTLTQLQQIISNTQKLGQQIKSLIYIMDGNNREINSTISQEINDSNSVMKSGNTTAVTDSTEITTSQQQDGRINNQTNPAEQKNEIAQKIENSEIFSENNKLSPSDFKTSVVKNAMKSRQEAINLSSLPQLSELTDALKTAFKVVNRENGDILAKDIQTQNQLREITQTLHTLKDKIEQLNIPEKSDLSNTIQHLQDNMAFLDQLTRFAALIPIPLNINGLDTTAELYVLKNKEKGKKIDVNNATILLSLFTANLGQVEVIAKTHYKSIECIFRSEQEAVLSFIRKNSTSLYQVLDTYGYRLSQVSYKHIEKQDAANILNVNEIRKQLDKKYSVDIRV